MFSDLLELLEIESVGGTAAEATAQLWVANKLRAWGWEVQLHQDDPAAFADHPDYPGMEVARTTVTSVIGHPPVVRGGIQSVDEGQSEAATALGMSRALALRLVILPQAMRAIIPPTGNEVISMLKTTSLVTAVPYTFDLYARARDLSVETFNPVPMLLIASTWYLLFTSILMVGQHYLERHFARGASRIMSDRQLQALADAEDDNLLKDAK